MGKKNYKNDRDFEKEYLKARQKELGEAFYSLLYRAYLKTDWAVYDKTNEQKEFDVKEENPLTEEELTNILSDYLNNSEHKENYAALFNRIIDALDKKIEPAKDELNKQETEEINRIKDIDKEIDRLNEEKQANINILSENFDNAAKELLNAKTKLEDYRNRINNPNVVEEKTKKFDDKYNEMKANVGKFDETISNLEAERAKEIKEITDKAFEDINNIKALRNEYEKSQIDFYDDLYKTNTELQDLDAKIKDYESGTMHTQYEKLVQELSSDNEVRNLLQGQYSSLRHSNETIKEKMKQYDSTVKAMDEITLDNFAKKLTSENNELKKKLNMFKSSYKKDEKDLVTLQDKIKKLEPEVREYISAVAAYNRLSEEEKNSTGFSTNMLRNDYEKFMQNRAKYDEMQQEFIQAKYDLGIIEARHEEEKAADEPYAKVYFSNQRYINEYKADKTNRDRYIKRQNELKGYNDLKEILNKLKEEVNELEKYTLQAKPVIVSSIILSLADVDKVNNQLVLKEKYNEYTYKGENPIKNIVDAYAKTITENEIKTIADAAVPREFGNQAAINAISNSVDKYINSVAEDIKDIEDFKKKDPVTNYKKEKLNDYYNLEARYNDNELEMKKISPKLDSLDRQVRLNGSIKLRTEQELAKLKESQSETKAKLNAYKKRIKEYGDAHKEFTDKVFEFRDKCNQLITNRDDKLKEIDDKYSKLIIDAKAEKDNYIEANNYEAYNKVAYRNEPKEKTEFILNEEEKTLNNEEKFKNDVLAKIEKLNIAKDARDKYAKGRAAEINKEIDDYNKQKNMPNQKLVEARRNYASKVSNKNLFLANYKDQIERESLTNEVYNKSRTANSIRHLAEDRPNKDVMEKAQSIGSDEPLIIDYTKDANKLIDEALPNLANVDCHTTTLTEAANTYEYAKAVSEDKEAYYNEKVDELSYDSIIPRSYRDNPRDVISYFDNPNNTRLVREMSDNHLFFCSREYKDFEKDLRTLSRNPENKEELMNLVRAEAKAYLDKKFAMDQSDLKDITKRRMSFALNTIAKIDAYKRAKDDKEVVNDRVNIEINLDNEQDDLDLSFDNNDELNNAIDLNEEQAENLKRQFNKPEKIK
jgi:hypothetical protein